jgi:hypothetical protein
MMEVIVKGCLSAIALALVLGISGATFTSSTADAQARVRVTPINPEARVAMCNAKVKGLYRSQQDGYVFPYGYCLSNVAIGFW